MSDPRCFEGQIPEEFEKITDKYIKPALNQNAHKRTAESSNGLAGYELDELEDEDGEDWGLPY